MSPVALCSMFLGPASRVVVSTGKINNPVVGCSQGRLPVTDLMNFRKTSKRPLNPSPPHTIFGKTMTCFLQRNFSGWSDSPFSFNEKSTTKFLGSEVTPPPPFRKFSKNSSNLIKSSLTCALNFINGHLGFLFFCRGSPFHEYFGPYI